MKRGDLNGDKTAFIAPDKGTKNGRSGVRASVGARKRASPPSKGTQGDGWGMSQATDDKPATVPKTAKQAGEVRARWAWAEPSVWTDRMLTALEQGVNLYLNDLDHQMARSGYEMTRYADDLVIQCRTREEAERALTLVQAWTAQAGPDAASREDQNRGRRDRGLRLSGLPVREASTLPAPQEPGEVPGRDPDENATDRGPQLEHDHRRCHRTLRGWLTYFQHSYRTTFPGLDGWIRMRLRSILRKRQGRSGRGRGADHHRWPNAYFTEQGLFSLTTAHALVSQSSMR